MATPRRGDPKQVEAAVARLIEALGLDPAEEPELAATPERVADLYAEAFAGLDPARAPDPATFPHADLSKRPGLKGAGSKIGSVPLTRSAIRWPAPGPMPKPCPEKPAARMNPGTCGTSPMPGTPSGVLSI